MKKKWLISFMSLQIAIYETVHVIFVFFACALMPVIVKVQLSLRVRCPTFGLNLYACPSFACSCSKGSG